MLLIVAYDVANNRRRRRLHQLLLGYGVPVQESVFECDLSVAQAQELKRRVGREIKQGTDRVNYYPLCLGCLRKAENERGQRHPPAPLVLVV